MNEDDPDRWKAKPALVRITVNDLHPPNHLPRTFREMLMFANYYVRKLDETQDILDVMPAVFATVHAVDWLVEQELKHDFQNGQLKADYTRRFPIWKSLKDVANGLKHANIEPASNPRRNLEAQQSGTEWENVDGWYHVHKPDQLVWRIEHEGDQHSIYSLCVRFLDEFSTWAFDEISKKNES